MTGTPFAHKKLFFFAHNCLYKKVDVFCDGQVEVDALQRSLAVRIEQLGRQGAPTARELPAALPLPASSLPGTAQPTTFTIRRHLH